MREPLPDPPYAADEKTMLVAFLDWYRDAVLRKVEGLDREALTRRLVASQTTLLGMVKHLAYVERGWFRITFNGEAVTRLRSPDDPLAEFRIEDDDTVDGVIGLYRDECERSRAIVAAAGLDDHAADKPKYTLRWIMVHLIEETARHAGHADILREQIDGVTGD